MATLLSKRTLQEKASNTTIGHMRVHSAIPICCTYIFVSSATLRWKQFKEYIGPFHFEPFYNSTSVELFVCDKIYALKHLKKMTKLISVNLTQSSRLRKN